MVMSVNTNIGAMVALQNLALTNKQLINTQLRVTTGLRVNGPKDDAATFAIAQNMRGAIAGYGSVGISLAMGESVVNVAIDAAKSIADILTLMKGKAVQASQDGMDQNSYNALHLEFTALREQLTTIVNTAEFNGKNLITSGAAAFNVLSTVEGSTILVSSAQMDTTTLAIHTAGLGTAVNAQTAITLLNAAIISVSNNLAVMGASSKRVDIQNDFVRKLMDVLKLGVGNLVDADLAAESANLQALQIKQQLGVQALSIANQNPQSILSLFQ
jgi:flagellin